MVEPYLMGFFLGGERDGEEVAAVDD